MNKNKTHGSNLAEVLGVAENKPFNYGDYVSQFVIDASGEMSYRNEPTNGWAPVTNAKLLTEMINDTSKIHGVCEYFSHELDIFETLVGMIGVRWIVINNGDDSMWMCFGDEKPIRNSAGDWLCQNGFEVPRGVNAMREFVDCGTSEPFDLMKALVMNRTYSDLSLETRHMFSKWGLFSQDPWKEISESDKLEDLIQ